MLDKTFDPAKIEDEQYKKWEASGAFRANPQGDGEPYTIMMPPPNVTGSLHVGHALTNTLQDVLTRYYRMKGKDALWQPGTDHAGIATQMVVERLLDKEGISRKDLGREEFINRVWQWKEESGDTIVKQLRKLGTTPDWSRERFTMDEGLSKAVHKVFTQLYKEGLIYKGQRLVNWDPKLETAISDLEVEQREQKGHMWHIAYTVEGDMAETITVATTRPETMLGDTAVAVHPDDERYKHLVGKYVSVPIANRLIPIIADEYADPEQGSGAVKITPAHDFNDFEVGERHNLPKINIFDTKACINENAPEAYQGLDRFDARKQILRELEELDVLIEVEDIKNSVPFGDRSGVIIEPFLTEQWYCDAKTLAKPALEAVKTGKTKFVPQNWENTYFHWMENIQPWCISRQLWWGHQIPAWYGPDGHVFVAETEDEAYKDSDAHYGESVSLTRDPDVLDTWFSSALWPFSTLGWPEETPELQKYYPGDVLVTGFDIIFFWVARMMMMGIHFMGDVPFKTIYMHALVRDAKGQKMSKSKGNVMNPLELTDQYGADALRFTLMAMAAQGRDIKLSEERIQGYRNFATKLWNAVRYCEMNESYYEHDFEPADVKLSVNKWIIGQVKETRAQLESDLEGYKFNEAANTIYHFAWGTFCDWYLEFTKPLLQDEASDTEKAEVRATTGWVIHQILSMLNPMMPFITEELHKAVHRDENAPLLMTSNWPKHEFDLDTSDANKEMEWLTALVTEIRSIRSDMNIPAGAKIPLYIKGANPQTRQWVVQTQDIIKRMARIESIEHCDETLKGAIQTVLDEITLIMPVADVIDLDQERARLEKEVGKLDKDIEGIDKKLANKKFVENAPEEVVQEQHRRKLEAQTKREKLDQALNQLQDA